MGNAWLHVLPPVPPIEGDFVEPAADPIDFRWYIERGLGPKTVEKVANGGWHGRAEFVVTPCGIRSFSSSSQGSA